MRIIQWLKFNCVKPLFFLLSAYAAYFIRALVYDATGAIPLVALTCSLLAIVLYEILMMRYRMRLNRGIANITNGNVKAKFSKCVKFYGTFCFDEKYVLIVGLLILMLTNKRKRMPVNRVIFHVSWPFLMLSLSLLSFSFFLITFFPLCRVSLFLKFLSFVVALYWIIPCPDILQSASWTLLDFAQIVTKCFTP